MVYKGLLWVGALQVDPGWQGYLPCPLYNMSNKEVTLFYKETLFTIDFVRTTRFNDGSQPYLMKFEPNPRIAIFDRNRLQSGPYDQLRRVSDVAREVTELRKYVERFVTFMLAALGIVVAAIGVIAAAPKEVGRTLTTTAFILGLTIFAAVIALASFNLASRRPLPRTGTDQGPEPPV